jgi:hypothetical protein
MFEPDVSPRIRSTRHVAPLSRFQFSLSSLLIVVTVVAVVLGLSAVFGNLIGALALAIVFCVLPTPLVICAIFARGDIQAFAIGALVPFVTMFASRPYQSYLAMIIWFLVLPGICGVVAVVTLRWVRRNRET